MGYDVCRLEGSDLPALCRPVEGAALVAQRLAVRLRTHAGEVARDRRLGLPWARWLSTRPAPVDEVRRAVRAEAASTPGVVEVETAEARVEGVAIIVRVVARVADGSRVAVDGRLVAPGAPGAGAPWAVFVERGAS